MKMAQKPALTIPALLEVSRGFAEEESGHSEKRLFGVTDGKAVGTYLEHKFQDRLAARYRYERGSSAKGIDLPELDIDIKTTSIAQPQSSCPFKSARQKIYGLGYSLLVFVYDKIDKSRTKSAVLNIRHVVFVEASRTAYFQTTSGIRGILENSGNADDLVAFMNDHLLPVDDIQARQLAEEILTHWPEVGCLTISNALQWRLQYGRAIVKAGEIEGVVRVV